MKESPPTKFKSTQKHQAGASKPFSLNPTGTLSRRHFAQFVSAIDTDVAYATLLARGKGSGTKDSLWRGLAYDGPRDVDSGLTTVQNFELCTTAKAGFGWEAVIRS